MGPDDQQKRERWINAYVDGRLNTEQRAAFEKLLAQNRALRQDVAAQMRIHRQLQTWFQPPAGDHVAQAVFGDHREPGRDGQATRARSDSNGRLRLRARSHDTDAHGAVQEAPAEAESGAETASPRRRLAWRRRTAVIGGMAAVLILSAVGYFLGWPSVATPDGRAPLTLASVYHREMEAGLKPTWKCENDEEFAGTFRDRLGQPLLLAQVPDDVEALGLSYRPAISLQTVLMLARVNGQPAVVFVDKSTRDRPDRAQPADGLNVFRRELGVFVLYEVTPLDHPRLLEHFYLPGTACKD